MDFLYEPWVQGVLVLILIALGVWWFKFRPQY
jgi:hypothetical protein